MEVKTIYLCSYCGEDWNSEDKCLKCEASHIRVSRVEPRYHRQAEYPNEVLIIYEDGREQRFFK